MIESTSAKIVYVVGTSPQYAFNIRFFSPDNIHCYLKQDNTETELVRGTDFAVESKTDYSTGANITLLLDPLPVGATLAIVREIPPVQDLALPEFGKLPSSALERILDKIVMIAQELKEKLSRAVVVAPTADADTTPEALIESIHSAARNAADSAQNAAQSAASVIEHAIAVPIGTVFAHISSLPPEGAYLLNGQTIADCRSLYPAFWSYLAAETAAGRVRTLADDAAFDAEILAAGNCGAFVIDGETGSVRLPSITGGFLQGGDGSNVGQSIAAGLPNITGSIDYVRVASAQDRPQNGALSSQRISVTTSGTESGTHAHRIDFDASESNSIYGNSDTVQPAAVRFVFCIQVYNATTALSEQQAAQLAGEMQLKAQLDLANTTANIDFIIEHWESDDGLMWYDKYRSGKVVQGGLTPVSSAAGVTTMTLPVEMADAEYTVLLTCYGDDGFHMQSGALAYHTVANLTAATFDYYASNVAHLRQQFWRAEGFAAAPAAEPAEEEEEQ